MNELKHAAIIMDKNRTWAKEKYGPLTPAVVWHKAWADNVQKIARLVQEKWIEYLTLWALSTENLIKRSKDEVSNIIKLLNNIEYYLGDMMNEWLRFNTIWDLSKLPDASQIIIENVKEKTKDNVWLVLSIGLIYGGQDEIIRWIKKFVLSWWDINDLTAESFRTYLDTWNLPNPDLIIRTGGDIRTSWFLLYDSPYSELYFTEKKWPEFDELELDKAIEYFKKCKRNWWA